MSNEENLELWFWYFWYCLLCCKSWERLNELNVIFFWKAVECLLLIEHNLLWYEGNVQLCVPCESTWTLFVSSVWCWWNYLISVKHLWKHVPFQYKRSLAVMDFVFKETLKVGLKRTWKKSFTEFDPTCHFSFTEANYSYQVSFYQVKVMASKKQASYVLT